MSQYVCTHCGYVMVDTGPGGERGIECVVCQMSPVRAPATVLHRLNQKGERGVWICDECLSKSPLVKPDVPTPAPATEERAEKCGDDGHLQPLVGVIGNTSFCSACAPAAHDLETCIAQMEQDFHVSLDECLDRAEAAEAQLATARERVAELEARIAQLEALISPHDLPPPLTPGPAGKGDRRDPRAYR